MTHRHQAHYFEQRLRAAGFEVPYNTDHSNMLWAQGIPTYRRNGWELKGASDYFEIDVSCWVDEDEQPIYEIADYRTEHEAMEPMYYGEFSVRFADHAQVPGGGFSQARQERMGEATISIDSTTGLTWRDICWWLGI